MKSYRVVITPYAEFLLSSLYRYIADRSSQARAEQFVGAIVQDCQSLSEFPERGTKRDDIRPKLRTKGYRKRVTIAFSVHEETRTVAIHGVFYGGQDFEELLRDLSPDDA